LRQQALDVLRAAPHLVHVGRRPADVGDRAAEVVHAAQRAHLAQHALRRADWMIRPSCSVIEQNVQPPKHPRITTIECFTVSNAGMGSS
jgi:hypothetical protein